MKENKSTTKGRWYFKVRRNSKTGRVMEARTKSSYLAFVYNHLLEKYRLTALSHWFVYATYRTKLNNGSIEKKPFFGHYQFVSLNKRKRVLRKQYVVPFKFYRKIKDIYQIWNECQEDFRKYVAKDFGDKVLYKYSSDDKYHYLELSGWRSSMRMNNPELQRISYEEWEEKRNEIHQNRLNAINNAKIKNE